MYRILLEMGFKLVIIYSPLVFKILSTKTYLPKEETELFLQENMYLKSLSIKLF